jgi:peptidoglycan/LPS O-acetylase OafA/YrhL
MSSTPGDGRIANLDLLRAAAIGLVVLGNAAGEGVLSTGPAWTHILQSGWVGVDLFFVLSGWLVGSLYWRERATFGDVQSVRFWLRRWLRTVPPYLVALALIVAGRALVLDEPLALDWHYLLFVQNYEVPIPYWAVSWSLAVEEHFYLLLPVVLGLALRVRGGVPMALGLVVLVSLVSRLLFVSEGFTLWGLHYTATHMRLEGLALGVAAAYVYHERSHLWSRVRAMAAVLLLPSLAFLAAVPWFSASFTAGFAYTGVDLACAVLLVSVVDRPAFRLGSPRLVRAVALTSYSVYMTHTAMLDLYRSVVMETFPALPSVVHALAALALVLAAGSAFYWAVEVPSLWFRERVAPRRPRVVAVPDVPAPSIRRPSRRPARGAVRRATGSVRAGERW